MELMNYQFMGDDGIVSDFVFAMLYFGDDVEPVQDFKFLRDLIHHIRNEQKWDYRLHWKMRELFGVRREDFMALRRMAHRNN